MAQDKRSRSKTRVRSGAAQAGSWGGRKAQSDTGRVQTVGESGTPVIKRSAQRPPSDTPRKDEPAPQRTQLLRSEPRRARAPQGQSQGAPAGGRPGGKPGQGRPDQGKPGPARGPGRSRATDGAPAKPQAQRPQRPQPQRPQWDDDSDSEPPMGKLRARDLPPGVTAEQVEALAKQYTPPPLERRALSHVGGHVDFWGDDSLAPALSAALAVTSDESEVRAHVHGFHSYPARLHPVTARELVRRMSAPGRRVLDPFCGSGTVAVEARLAGRRMGGSDANPFAVELAKLKTGGKLDGLAVAAESVAEHADDRRERKAGPTKKYAPVDRELFDVHVLLELDGLKAGIEQVQDPALRHALSLVLTSILTKVSKSPGDTRQATMKRRLATGFTIRTFLAKAEELEGRLEEFDALLPERALRPHLEVSDARRLRYVQPASVELVLCSPPYPGVYDYVKHHETRMRWLGLETQEFSRNEIGSQRRLAGQDFARAAGRWDKDLAPCLQAMRNGLAENGHIVLVLADTVLGGRAWLADRALRDLAPKVGLRLKSVASQQRPVFLQAAVEVFRSQPRREHLLVLTHA